MESRPSSVGSGISIIRSKRPGGEAPVQDIDPVCGTDDLHIAPVLEPVHARRSCISVRWTSRSPEVFASVRDAPTASISSMKMMVGAFFLARSKSPGQPRTFPDIFLDQLRTHDPHEMGIGLVGYRFCKQGLSRARGAME